MSTCEDLRNLGGTTVGEKFWEFSTEILMPTRMATAPMGRMNSKIEATHLLLR